LGFTAATLSIRACALRRPLPGGAAMAGYPVNRGDLAASTFLARGRTRTLAVALHLGEAVAQFVPGATTVATFVRTVAR
jgi:hypothetical protein